VRLFVYAASASEESSLARASTEASNPAVLGGGQDALLPGYTCTRSRQSRGRILREDATVTVTECKPDCASPHGVGAGSALMVPSSLLCSTRDPADAPSAPSAENLCTDAAGIGYLSSRAPTDHSGANQEKPRMAFLPNVDLRTQGWLERVEGGFVPARRVQMLAPSRFQGERGLNCRLHSLSANMPRRQRPDCSATTESRCGKSTRLASRRTAGR